jgi:hypothetical protein
MKRSKAVAFLFSSIFAIWVADAFAQNQGRIDGHTYLNPYLGLTIRLAGDLSFDEAGKMQPTSGSFVLFNAYGPRRLLAGSLATVFYAEKLSSYPEIQRTSDAYIQMITDNQTNTGYRVLHPKAKCQIGSRDFIRADFEKNMTYQAFLVTIIRGYFLIGIFGAGSEKELDKLISSTSIVFAEQ